MAVLLRSGQFTRFVVLASPVQKARPGEARNARANILRSQDWYKYPRHPVPNPLRQRSGQQFLFRHLLACGQLPGELLIELGRKYVIEARQVELEVQTQAARVPV